MEIAAQFYTLDALPTVSFEKRALAMMRKNTVCGRCRELNKVSAGVKPVTYPQHHGILENTVVKVRTSDFKVKNVSHYNHTVRKFVSSDILNK
jgi:hypothetical protein